MPKQKKTRKQKELADNRRQTHHHEAKQTHTDASSVVYTTSQTPVVKHTTNTSSTPAIYDYVPTDLYKTLTITAAIVVLELILKFVAHV